jgi:hypothetical protein
VWEKLSQPPDHLAVSPAHAELAFVPECDGGSVDVHSDELVEGRSEFVCADAILR